MGERGGWVYILTNRPHGTLYVGVTADLVRRVSKHRAGEVAGFTRRSGLTRLVWLERHGDILQAIAREKPIKRWVRVWKDALIEEGNPEWDDLFGEIL